MHSRAAEFCDRCRTRFGFDPEVKEFPEGTKTAADAAEAIGCDVAQIASSIAIDVDESLIVVITSGANRVDLGEVARLRSTDEDLVSMADAETVKETLGWTIGGVPPFLHETDVPVYLDTTLCDYETVWAAAGTPEAVFPIAPRRLRELAGATLATVAE